MRKNRHCQTYWQTLYPEKNVTRNTVLQQRWYKWQLLLGGKTLSLGSSADADREKYNKRGHGVDSGQKLLMRRGHKYSVCTISS